ncbi:phosphoethanolamine--lipid A transferase [Halarcobacter sp.]|uniref:phosphoethanolamine transferase n=1 Tax=Halarcobacter sp. TaxID=2321133 RepID=UPI002AA8C9D8|nr:phosphoethanolamine--lipid A transferase [Halarcobacter sp.]
MKNITQYKLITLSALVFALFYNFTFIREFSKVYDLVGVNIIYFLSVFVVFIFLNVFLFTLISSRYSTKPFLILVFMVSSFVAYFMDTYNIVVDSEMIRNTLQTNIDESLDLFSMKLVLYVFFLGLVPSFLVYKSKIKYENIKKEAIKKLKVLFFCFFIIIVIIFSFSKFYASFFREHKSLRYYINPTYWVYSIGNYFTKSITPDTTQFKIIGADAKITPPLDEVDKKELIIMVVGEASRADRFSLNGYEKQTNPLLEKEDIVNFSNMYSCGTSTAVSVPCMFSIYTKDDYSYKKGISTENVVDVLTDTKDVKVLWRDNNSDSKGVALRVDFQDYRTAKNNKVCDLECRDEGMLIGLDEYIKQNKNEDIFIVLHQMGNHGPAYYKRYPKEFEKFTPVCKTNELEKCTQEEVSNAYDNAILYTDYFLSKVINFLKPYSKDYETAMLYMSDHGESLGENSLYLHGMPYLIAPENQKHVASFIWLGKGDIREDIDVEKLKSYSNKRFSQDNLFHTLLGLFEVESKVYKKELDILNDAKID